MHNTSKQRKIDALVVEKNELQARIDKLTDKHSDKSKANDDKASRIVMLQTKVDEVTVQKNKLLKNVDDLKAHNAEKTKKVDELTAVINKQVTKIESLQIELK